MSYIFGPNASAALVRAADRARKVLKPGDRVTLGSSCGGGVQTVTFSHFSDVWGLPDPNSTTFSSRSLDDLSPWNITKINGRPISFRDEAGQAAFGADTNRFGAERVQQRRSSFRVVPSPNNTAQEEGKAGNG